MPDDDGTKNPLVVAAAAVERTRAIARGYLKKKTSSPSKNVWQRRFFFILPGENGGSYYLAYCKTDAPGSPILASMDLAQAGSVHVVEGDGNGCQFGLQWDKHRVFLASSAEECQMWVSTIKRVQAEASRRGAKDWGAGSKRAENKPACCSVQ